MKNKNIFLVILFGVITLLFSSKVMAADSNAIIGYVKCKYQLNKSDVMWQADGDNNISFAYTDISFEDSSIKGSVFIIDPDIGTYLLARKRGTYSTSAGGFAKVITDHLSNVDLTFRAHLGVNGECPKYFYLLKSSNKYVPFFNGETTSCGQDLSLCAVVGTNLPKEGEIYTLYDGEQEWVTDFSGVRSCDSAHMRLYLDGTTIKGELSYPDGTSFYEQSIKQQSNINIYAAHDSGYSISMKYIYNLLKNNTIERGFIRGDAGNAKIHFNDDGVSYYSCNMSANSILTKKYNCVTSAGDDKVQEIIGSTAHNYSSKVEDFREYVRGKLCDSGESLFSLGLSGDERLYFYYEDRYICDYSSYTKEQLLELAEEITSSAIEYGDELSSLWSTYNVKAVEASKLLCQHVSKDSLTATWKSKRESHQIVGLSILKALEQHIMNQKNILDSEEAKTQMEATLGKLDKFIEENNHYYEVMDNYYFMSEASLNFASDCGIITPKLKQWLIRGLDILKVVSLVLTLILGMIDFFRGLASGSADTMKKVWTSFSRRLIVVVILFLLPVILEFIFGVVNIEGVISTDPLCGIK